MPQLRCHKANIFYVEYGSGTETIIFSHGLMFNNHQWDKQLDYFKVHYRCIAYDHRGQGQSESVGGRDMDTLYEDAASLIEQLSPGKPVHFVGLSMGGFVGMRLAARKPHLLKSLTLLETSADQEVNKFKYNLLIWIFKIFGTKAVIKNIIGILFGKSSIKDLSKQELLNYWKSQIKSYSSSIILATHGVIHRRSVYDEIAKIMLPVQVIVGEEDLATVPEKSYRIHRQIKNSTLTIIPKAGHSSCIEQPEAVNKLIEGLIQKVSAK